MNIFDNMIFIIYLCIFGTSIHICYIFFLFLWQSRKTKTPRRKKNYFHSLLLNTFSFWKWYENGKNALLLCMQTSLSDHHHRFSVKEKRTFTSLTKVLYQVGAKRSGFA